MSDYDTDILVWSEQQAALLRRFAATSPSGSNELDWANIAEEIEAVGRSELHAVESLLFQALVHMLKAEAWPLSEAVAHWQAEARGFRFRASRRYTPGMAQRLDVQVIYAAAIRAIPETMDGQPPLPVPETCPAALDELLSD